MSASTNERGTSRIEYCRFAIDETPVCVWSDDLGRDNRQYLNAINGEYFEKVADMLVGSGFDGPEGQVRAIAIRTLYGQATEALLALLAATAQAPDCVPGWMGRYQNKELDSIVAKISRGQPILTRFSTGFVTWQSLSGFVHQHLKSDNPELRAKCIDGFANLWNRLAGEHQEPHNSREYNALKHGLRTRAGGFSIAIGLEDIPGVPCPPEKMGPHLGSDFGTSTVAPLKLEGTKRHFQFASVANNWDPKVLALRLGLISASMGNVLSRLKLLAGEPPQKYVLHYPADLGAFAEAWPDRAWPFNFMSKTVIESQHIQNLGDEEILAAYQRPAQDKASK